ncbi:TonB family protein [Paucimonas lemoignei]|uniref:TonB family protein n=1 Tax=Paucimonas lemoignei TaxID=29443 RepID=UPI00104B8BFF|nr:TonB family protein [Paucimonas lemoignei]
MRLASKRIYYTFVIAFVFGTANAGNADQEYLSKLSALIRSNAMFAFPKEEFKNDPVKYEISLMPDGSIKSIQKLKASEVKGFDEAVLRAIRISEPFPKNKFGKLPTGFILEHYPKDRDQ